MVEDNEKSKSNANGDSLQIKAESLKQKIDKGEDIFILDVRTPEEHKAWKISYDKYKDSSLIPIDDLSLPDALKNIPKDKEIVTFCGHGNRSMSAAKILSQHGYNSKSIKGGLDEWNHVYDVAVIPAIDSYKSSSSPVRVWQLRRVSKGCMTYLVSSASKSDGGSSRNAIVIDPTCGVSEPINKIAKENNLSITNVIDTHMHADHVSGATKLAELTGNGVYVSSIEGYQIDQHEKNNNNNKGVTIVNQIRDGDKIALSNGIHLDAIHTPGHTKGSISFRLTLNDNTNYLFTGDLLFVDGIGRPDLHDKAEEFASSLFNTYHEKILNLPDETIILPAHFSGTFEHEKPVFGSIGTIKKRVKVLSVSQNEFAKFIMNNIPAQPMNYKKIIDINKDLIRCDTIKVSDLEAGPNSCGIAG
jgi:glyoxylase-like metal-dependent hydrolase (beta-lactamase superfamily II)/rhodanese-related sulfurtransferase